MTLHPYHRIFAASGRVDICSTYNDINLETACEVLQFWEGWSMCVCFFCYMCDNLLTTLFVFADLTSCSRALQYALKHPLVVPDTGAPSHSAGYRRDYLKRKVSTGYSTPKSSCYHDLALFPGLPMFALQATNVQRPRDHGPLCK